MTLYAIEFLDEACTEGRRYTLRMVPHETGESQPSKDKPALKVQQILTVLQESVARDPEDVKRARKFSVCRDLAEAIYEEFAS